MVDVRGSRILADLDSAFKQDPDIDEYDYLPILEPVQNCSPLVKVEHKIALEMWSVKILYSYAYEKLISWRKKESETRCISPEQVNSLTRAVLLINPDVATVWNIRKEQVKNNVLSIEDDLKLGVLILQKHPKSPETFSHRKWLLEQSMLSLPGVSEYLSQFGDISSVNIDSIDIQISGVSNACFREGRVPMPEAVRAIFETEVSVCSKAADKYASNYNAWSHRIWTIQHVTRNDVGVILSELSSTKNWVSMHISDHSGFHFRQFLITLLCNHNELEQEEIKRILSDELVLTTELIKCYTDHEAVWCHRRYVITYLQHHPDAVALQINLGCENEGFVDSEVVLGNKKTKIERSPNDILHDELEFIKQFDKSKITTVKMLQKKYKDWLHRTMNE